MTSNGNFNLDGLKCLAVRGLAQMFDPETQLFCYRLNQVGDRLVREGISHRYTIMSLLGLYEWECAGDVSPINLKVATNNLIKDLNWIDNAGDLGLLLWLCARTGHEDLEYLCLNAATSWATQPDTQARRTMELAWLLTGLSHAAIALPEKRAGLASLATSVYDLLKENQGKSGILGHLGRTKTVSGMMRGRIGSFADQVYPIYAFSQFAKAYELDEPLELALRCGNAICNLQGSLGQWWWHYDSVTGKVVQRYPVYSVHQHGMAPLALYALASISKKDFTEPIRKGLNWINSDNELRSDMRDREEILVWRSVFPVNKYEAYFKDVANFLITSGSTPGHFSIRTECRPYELGWLLYAFAPRQTVESAQRN
jgi:hypothetical protein